MTTNKNQDSTTHTNTCYYPSGVPNQKQFMNFRHASLHGGSLLQDYSQNRPPNYCRHQASPDCTGPSRVLCLMVRKTTHTYQNSQH
jgi:hypothetical protein